MERTHASAVDNVNGYTQLIAPRTCGADPVRSITMLSSRMVTAASMRIGSGSTPSPSR